MMEQYRPHILNKVKISNTPEFSQKADQLIESLETREWMNPPCVHWLDNQGKIANLPFTIAYQTQSEATSASGSANSGDTWIEAYQSLSMAVNLSGRKNEFDQVWKKLKDTAITTTQRSKAFSTINSSSLLEPGSVAKHGLERLTLSQNTFASDAALYGCFQYFSDLVGNQKYPNYINQRWEIWRNGFGVTRDKFFLGDYRFYCYKNI